MSPHPTQSPARAMAGETGNTLAAGGPALDVCLAMPLFHPDYSGAAVRFQRYAPGFAARGIDMRVFARSRLAEGTPNEPPGGQRLSGGLTAVEKVDDIPVRRVRIASQGRMREEVTFFRALAHHCRQAPVPDVLNIFRLGAWSFPWLLQLRRLGIPMVYTATMLRDPSVPRAKLLPLILSYGMMDCVVASTSVMRDDLRAEGARCPIEVIPNGVDLRRFRPLESRSDRLALKRQLGLNPEAELIVFVGGFLCERKGVDVLADAWRILAPRRPRAQLALIGPHVNRSKADEQDNFLGRVNTSLDASGARDRVIAPGAVTNVEQYLQVADVFAFPSRREGMGNVVLEAFGCGVPSVLTPFVGLPAEFGRPGEQYVLCERTADAMANAISTLLDDPTQRQTISRKARRWVEDEMDVNRSLDRYATLYRDLAKRSGSRVRA